MRAIIYFEGKEVDLFEFEDMVYDDESEVNLYIFRSKQGIAAIVPKTYMIVIKEKIKDV